VIPSISLKNINKLEFNEAIENFARLFNYRDSDLFKDYENISNFLTVSYVIAEQDFTNKLSISEYLDESMFFVYDKWDNLIGYCCIFPNVWVPENDGVELGLFIRASDRNKGYGTQILDKLEQIIIDTSPGIQNIILTPILQNERAINLYQRLGWVLDLNSLALYRDRAYMIKQITSKVS
jgi:RimJ/RimL family protein N-acetyltransferase